jgi:hypothetical protein
VPADGICSLWKRDFCACPLADASENYTSFGPHEKRALTSPSGTSRHRPTVRFRATAATAFVGRALRTARIGPRNSSGLRGDDKFERGATLQLRRARWRPIHG